MIFDRNENREVIALLGAGSMGTAMRTASSDEIADAAAFLLGSQASFITGIDLLMDGGVIATRRVSA